MTIIELRPQSILRRKRKNPNTLSAELVFLPIALAVALTGLLPPTAEKLTKETWQSLRFKALNFFALL
jgi:hypothetical protein